MNGWRLRLSARSAALVGGIADAPAGVHAATAALDGASGEPKLLLPGTSVRGVLRDAFRRFAAARGHECKGDESFPCPTCELFGASDRRGALWIRSATAGGERQLVAGVAIDRARRTAARPEGALWVEERGVASFEVLVTATRPLTEKEAALLGDFWAWLEAVGLSVGRRKSAGVGRFDVEVLEHESPSPMLPAPSLQDGEPVGRYLLRLRLKEPTRLVGLRQRDFYHDFYRDGLDVIPISTLRGALGWALERQGASAAAADLFVERPILLTPAFPLVGSDLGAPPWLTRFGCTGEPQHIVDGALDRVAEALSGAPTGRLATCPVCGAELRGLEPIPPVTLVTGHVSLDPHLRRARRGDLHYQVSIAPGTVFVGELLARPSQVEALRALDRVLVGGRRARGMGLACLEIEDLPLLPPVRERIEATSHWLGERYGIREQIAVVGLLTDAATDPPLAQILTEAGLEIVTGEVRDVLRGGWDEQQGRMRPLRRLLAAGSWVATRLTTPGALEGLERLELQSVFDPEGTAPLVIRVREDWMHNTWEAREMNMEDMASAETTSDLDQLVRDARRLCESADQLPDRAALQTLLRFAQSTPSVEETVLFIQYQASRDQHRKHREFLRAVAEHIGQRFPSDPEGARRFLGLIVRAGYVELVKRKSDSSDRSGRGAPARSQGGLDAGR